MPLRSCNWTPGRKKCARGPRGLSGGLTGQAKVLFWGGRAGEEESWRGIELQILSSENTNTVYWCIYMEFRKMVTMTLYARQQKRHRCIEQSLGLCGSRWGWDDLREWHWNMYITICEADRQSRFDAWDTLLRAGALGWPWGMGWGGRWEGGAGWGTRVHPQLIHVSVWQNPLQYCKVISLQLKSIN